jgi:hypothetical protein
MSEPDLYDRARGEFSLSYRYLLTLADAANHVRDTIQNALAASGLWRPVPNNNYTLWANSMKTLRVWDPRGYAGLSFKNSDDLIIDLCLNTNAPTVPVESPSVLNGVNPAALLNRMNPPPADQSIVDYHLEMHVRPTHHTVELKALPTAPVNYAPSATDLNATGGYRSPYNGSNPSVVQQRNVPSYRITLAGYAVRAGYPVTPPRIVSLAGQTLAPAPGSGDFFHTYIGGNVTVPLVYAFWSASYILPDNLQQGIVAPDNPILGSLGTQNLLRAGPVFRVGPALRTGG